MSVIRCQKRVGRLASAGMLSTALFACCSVQAGTGTPASDASAAASVTAAPESDFNNWIELEIGGLIIHGDTAQFKQEHRMSGNVFGGIQDMHLERSFGKDTQLTIDGHAIADNNDYDIRIDLTKTNVGYIRGGYNSFRTWYDGSGGYFPANGQFFSPPIPEMHIDRSEAWVELGLRLPDWPEITIRYSHELRDGEKDSTIWGDTTLTGLSTARKIAPAYRDIYEARDLFSFDAVKTFGNTDIDLGMRYEHDNNDDSLQLWRGAGQLLSITGSPPTITGAQRFITENEKDNIDMFSGHVTTETRFSDSLWFTTAYSYTTLNSDISGSRIYGEDYNSTYNDSLVAIGLQNRDEGFINLVGMSQVDDHVFNMNLMWTPMKNLSVISGFRYTHENQNSDSMYLDTTTVANTAPYTSTNPKGGYHLGAPALDLADTAEAFDNFAERLEIRYSGIANWLFYANNEWEEESGNIYEHQVIGGVNQGALNKNTSLLLQKYTVGANWYPRANLSVSAQYYYKIASYDNSFDSELAVSPTPGSERNQRLLWQDWSTNDANIRVTWRPQIPSFLGTLAIVSRYDYVSAHISDAWAVSPTQSGSAPTNTYYDAQNTALITNHVITESVTWSPVPRFYVQGDVSYVLDETKTPIANIDLIPYTSPSVENFKNDYWTVTGAVGFVLDDKTDLRADYTYYCASNYSNNYLVGMPYGIGANEHTVAATVTRQLNPRVRLLLKYNYFNYMDETFGGHTNYEAHSISSSVQFKF